MNFDEMVGQATGRPPYAYQKSLAAEGPPDVLSIPTGAGKTLAAVLPWLYRRRFHPDVDVRAATPRRLVFALPMRVLVEQTYAVVTEWMERLEISDDVQVHRVMGGEGRIAGGWRDGCDRDAVLIGTIDMLLSRALNRGYGDSRWMWPIDFGLLSSDTHWVFDEVQLMGPALPTSRQLAAFRRSLGTVGPASSMWMSATVDQSALSTVDNPVIGNVRHIEDVDRQGPLARRLGAPKVVRRVETDRKRHERDVADLAIAEHRPGTLTIVIANTVQRATEIHRRIQKGAGDTDLVLVHSRFRPPDRSAIVERLTSAVPEAGRIVVSTQVIEAGVDLSASVLITELAPWPSIVQRAGRCNRSGEVDDARVLWVHPHKPAPYEQTDLDQAEAVLDRIEGAAVTPESLSAEVVESPPVIHPVLRRRDLVDLFDTTPDLSGNDVDVARFIRSADETDAYVAWWELDDQAPVSSAGLPARNERCPVPVADLREWIKTSGPASKVPAWKFDHIGNAWVRCSRNDVTSGSVIVLDADAGGYSPDSGWSPKSKASVAPVLQAVGERLGDDDTGTGADPVTFTSGVWLSLETHLSDTEAAVAQIVEQLGPALSNVDPVLVEAAGVAGRLHDIGKAHPVFQATLERAIDGDDAAAAAAGRPWAKAARNSGGHSRRSFRHEFASALALLDTGSAVLDGYAERDLICYLVAAHHGRVRIGARSIPGENDVDGTATATMLGVEDGEELPAIAIPGGVVPASIMRLGVMGLGGTGGEQEPWVRLASRLRDRSDLGVFRLAFLEALVRMADWRASADAASRGGAS